MIEIRTMDGADYDALWALWMSCKNMGFNDVDDSREGIARFLARNPQTSFVALSDGALVGAILGGQDGRRGYIYHLSVAGDFRRQGIGGKLVDACLQAMKAQGINKVALLVFHYNETGNAFWEKQGFARRTDVAYHNRLLREMTRIDT